MNKEDVIIQQADAWMAVCATLSQVMPKWGLAGGTGKENAITAIRKLAARDIEAIAAAQERAEPVAPAVGLSDETFALLVEALYGPYMSASVHATRIACVRDALRIIALTKLVRISEDLGLYEEATKQPSELESVGEDLTYYVAGPYLTGAHAGFHAVAELATARIVHFFKPDQVAKDEWRAAYAKGFYAALGRAKRPDLYADIGSQAYVEEMEAFRATPPAPAQPAQGVVPSWRDHVEQRIRTWKQRTMNKSGDCLAIDDFMGQDSIDDLVDFVCDEWAITGEPDPWEEMKKGECSLCGAPGFHKCAVAEELNQRAAQPSPEPSKPEQAEAPSARDVAADLVRRYCKPVEEEVHEFDRGFEAGRIDDAVKIATRLAGLYKQIEDLTRDRDEWKQQHENLLFVRQQDLAALTATLPPASAAGEREALLRDCAAYLSVLYAKYQTRIGPFASQAQLLNVRIGAALATKPQAEQEAAGLPPLYMLAKLQMVMPLFQEARDALTAITEAQRKLHGISSSLDVRMDEAGTFSIDDWRAASNSGGAA